MMQMRRGLGLEFNYVNHLRKMRRRYVLEFDRKDHLM